MLGSFCNDFVMNKLAIVGYGKMGKLIEQIAPGYGFAVCAVIDPQLGNAINKESLAGAELAVEFTAPSAAPGNLRALAEAGVPVVCGTTGWDAELDAVRQLFVDRGLGIFTSPNFSVGMNIVFELNRLLARLAAGQGFVAGIEETHHAAKVDKPSGTAVRLANDLIREGGDYSAWESDPAAPRPGTLPVVSYRRGDVVGEHAVEYRSGREIITLRHQALDRGCLVDGVLKACRFMVGRVGAYTMRDLLEGRQAARG